MNGLQLPGAFAGELEQGADARDRGRPARAGAYGEPATVPRPGGADGATS